MIDLSKFSHGDTLPNGCMCWVGMDGVARAVTTDMFNTLTDTTKLNLRIMDEINARLECDAGGIQTAISIVVGELRFRNELLSAEELETIFSSVHLEDQSREIGNAYGRIESEYGL